jgi:putative protease
MLAVQDGDGRVCTTEGSVPEPAFNKELIDAQLKTQLYKTGGTPYSCTGVKSYIDKGLSLPVSSINSMRRDVLDKLTAARAEVTSREERDFHAGLHYINRTEKPVFTVSVMKAEQISSDLLSLTPKLIYITLAEAVSRPERVRPLQISPCHGFVHSRIIVVTGISHIRRSQGDLSHSVRPP